MPVKNNFMHYMEWIRVMLPVFFEELELVCIFFLSLSLSIAKRSTLAKIWGSSSPTPPPQSPRFLPFFIILRLF